MLCKRAVAAFATALLIGLAGLLPASARSRMPLEDPWNPAHLEGLPREVRANIERTTRACGAPIAAQHLVSRYIQDRVTGDRFVAIHFDQVHCVNRTAICTTAGCLHQVYVSKDGSYRLILSVYAPEIELKLFHGSAAVEIACDHPTEGCSRVLRWDGSHLHSAR
jgi:hypothetical protein